MYFNINLVLDTMFRASKSLELTFYYSFYIQNAQRALLTKLPNKYIFRNNDFKLKSNIYFYL